MTGKEVNHDFFSVLTSLIVPIILLDSDMQIRIKHWIVNLVMSNVSIVLRQCIKPLIVRVIVE